MDDKLMFELYKLFRGELTGLFELHQTTLRNYLAFATAVLGATIAGLFYVQGIGWKGTVLVLGPILNLLVCVLAIRNCSRHYVAALERVVITAKLESALGLQERERSANAGQSAEAVFPEDRYFLPERWLKDRSCDTSEEYIRRALKGGINRLAKWVFLVLIAVNVILGTAIMLMVFL